jgi:hypothetical protein
MIGDQALEDVREPARRHRVAIAIGEHIPAVAVVLAVGVGLRQMLRAVRVQRSDRGAVQRDHPGAVPGLRRAHRQPPVPRLQLPADDRGALLQVDIAPPQPDRLTAPQPPQRDQMKRRIQPMRPYGVQELRGLRRRPHRDRGPLPGLAPVNHPRGESAPEIVHGSHHTSILGCDRYHGTPSASF